MNWNIFALYKDDVLKWKAIININLELILCEWWRIDDVRQNIIECYNNSSDVNESHKFDDISISI